MADSTTARVVASGWRFQLRELLLLILLIAVALAWWRDHQQQTKRQELYERQIGQLQERRGASVSATELVLEQYKQSLAQYQMELAQHRNELERYQLERLAWTTRSYQPFQPRSTATVTPAEFLQIMRKGENNSFHSALQPFLASANASEAIPELIKLLANPNPTVRGQSVQSLGRLRGSPETTVPALIPLLSDPERFVRNAAAYALGAFRSDAKTAIPALTALMNNDDDPTAVTAIIVLSEIDSQHKPASRLIELLSSPNVTVRATAVMQLDRYVEAEEIERVLSEMYASEDNEQVRRAIARTLNETGRWKSK